MLDKLLKFSEKEFDEVKKDIKKLFEEEIQSHKNKQFVKVQLFQNSYELCISTDKFSIYFKKKILNSEKVVLRSYIELFNISKNNIEKNSDRIRWIIEIVDKVIKLNNNSLTKIEMFAELYKNNILEDLKRENINLICEDYIDFIVFCDNDIKFDFKNENDYNFILLNNSLHIVTQDILNKVNKLINIILKYWNDMINKK